MARTIRVTSSGSIKRPVEEVRQQFADMAYHAAAGVHASVRFAGGSQDEQQCRYRQEVTLLGLRQADDLLSSWLPDGSLQSEAVAGTNKGLRVLYRFAGSANRAVVWVTFEVPAPGGKAADRAPVPARATAGLAEGLRGRSAGSGERGGRRLVGGPVLARGHQAERVGSALTTPHRTYQRRDTEHSSFTLSSASTWSSFREVRTAATDTACPLRRARSSAPSSRAACWPMPSHGFGDSRSYALTE